MNDSIAVNWYGASNVVMYSHTCIDIAGTVAYITSNGIRLLTCMNLPSYSMHYWFAIGF